MVKAPIYFEFPAKLKDLMTDLKKIAFGGGASLFQFFCKTVWAWNKNLKKNSFWWRCLLKLWHISFKLRQILTFGGGASFFRSSKSFRELVGCVSSHNPQRPEQTNKQTGQQQRYNSPGSIIFRFVFRTRNTPDPVVSLVFIFELLEPGGATAQSPPPFIVSYRGCQWV